jgi:cytochrome bd ubiquinol oxidase subunit II
VIPLWFILVTILWTGFFVLEGFDFGVGMLHAVIGRDDAGRSAAIATVGPLWDGNEVWLVVAAAAMFAAFPAWYATMFSGFYLVVVVLLVALIVRGVAFEFRGKRESVRWRRTWSRLMIAGSVAAPFFISLALGDLLHGVPIGRNQQFTGSVGDLFQPYAIYTGVTLVLICVLHGATFLSLKTTGELRDRAARLARRVAVVTAIAVLAFASWTHASAGKGALLNPVEFAAVVAGFAAVWFVFERREGWAFTATTVMMAASVLSIFVDLYPRVLVSSTSPAFDLTVRNTASGSYSLAVMTVVAAIALPFVLGYQAWTYFVFRRRLNADAFRRRPARARVAGATPVAGAGTAGAATAGSAGDAGAYGATASAATLAGADPARDDQAGRARSGEAAAGRGGDGSAISGSPATRPAGHRAPPGKGRARSRHGWWPFSRGDRSRD